MTVLRGIASLALGGLATIGSIIAIAVVAFGIPIGIGRLVMGGQDAITGDVGYPSYWLGGVIVILILAIVLAVGWQITGEWNIFVGRG